MKVYVKTVFVTAVYLLLLGSSSAIPLSGYFDELIGLLMTAAVFWGIFRNRFKGRIVVPFVSFVVILLIGVISNAFSGLVEQISYIVSDFFSFTRIFVVYFGVSVLMNHNQKLIKKTVDVLGWISVVFITASFVFGVLNLLGIVKMHSTIRYGIPNYYFFFGNASMLGIFLGAALALAIYSGKDTLWIRIMALAGMVMTVKGTSLIIVTVYLVLNLFVKRKIKVWHLLLGAAVLGYVLRFQIQAYLINDAAPRAILLRYGLVTALDYFPLGAGFAAYGSNMAAVHYSPLYIKYGFDSRKALMQIVEGETRYLNDTYLGMIFGQFGLIGTVLFALIFFKMWQDIRRAQCDTKTRNITVAMFACLCGSFVMLGSIKNSPGQVIMLILSLFIQIYDKSSKDPGLQSKEVIDFGKKKR